ncbi:MAG: hypothetical protein ABI599_06760 [Flavobacteriales bacterium]
MRTAARVLSILLHPLWMPLFIFLLAFWLVPHLGYFMVPQAIWFNHIVIGVMTGVFPLIGAALMLRARRTNGLVMEDRKQRIAPLLSTLLYYCLTYWLLRKYPHHPAALSMFLGCTVSLACVLIISLFWKISLHMAGIGGLIGALAALQIVFGSFSVLVLVPFIALAGLLGTARLVDSDHTPAQVYTGAVVGFVSVFGCMMGGLVI